MIKAIVEGYCNPAFKKEQYELENWKGGVKVMISVSTMVGKDKLIDKNIYNYVTVTLWNKSAEAFFKAQPKIAKFEGSLKQNTQKYLEMSANVWEEITSFKKEEAPKNDFEKIQEKREQNELELVKRYDSQKEEAILWDE